MKLSRKIFGLRWWLGLSPGFTKGEVPNFKIAIIIPAYNEEKCIADTIRSIKKQTVKIDQIIVVDDCSKDRTGEISKKMGATVVKTLKNQGTKAMAQNYILPKLNVDLVITIDADTLLAPDAIEKTLPYFCSDKTFAVCGFVIPQKIETIWERGRYIEYIYGITILKAAQNNAGLIMVASGCFTVFRYSVIKELGFFNERTMAEDMDLTWEALFRGYEVYCVQDAYCYPLDPSTISIYYKQLRRWYSGFLQNLRLHKFDLVKNWKFGLLFTYYLLEASVYPILSVIFLALFIEMWRFLILIFLLHAMMILTPSLIKGWRLGMFWKTLTSFPAYYATRPVNIAALYATIYKEWIVREKLKIWNKGH